MSTSVTILDAYRTWLSGKSLDEQDRLWGLPMIWWGRSGKILAFVAGATVILDIIGPERLREWGNNKKAAIARTEDFFRYLIIPAAGLIAFFAVQRTYADNPVAGLIGTVIVLVLSATLTLVFRRLVPMIGVGIVKILDTDRPANILRKVAAILLAVGFHFDLLAS